MGDTVIVAVVTLVGVLVTASLAFMSNMNARRGLAQATQINDAVNHRQRNEPRLFEVVKQIRAHQVVQEERMDVYDMRLDLVQTLVHHHNQEEPGADGATGRTGRTGPSGHTGPRGTAGADGADGMDGQDGADGTDWGV